MSNPSAKEQAKCQPVVTIFLLMLLLTAAFLSPALAETKKADRPARWATPIILAGAPNLNRIDDGLYRSAQPTKEGMKNLEKLGIRTVINLRAFHSDSDELKGTGLLNSGLSVKTWHIEDEDVVQVLRILAHRENGPFLIHCQHGADRTGVMSAMYRIVAQGWSKEEAIDEMVNGGYGFHPVWTNIIDYARKADIERIREQAKSGGTAKK